MIIFEKQIYSDLECGIRPRQIARNLVNTKIRELSFGAISLDDLPDTSDLCQIVDAMEEVISNMSDSSAMEKIRNLLEEVDQPFLEMMLGD